MNKHQLIKLQDKFILVSDEEIKENDTVYDTYSGLIQLFKIGVNDGNASDFLFKIIAGIPKLPSIDLSLLSEKDCKTIRWVDVEKLAKETTKKYINEREKQTAYLEFIEAFKTAQSLNDKRFSLEDMKSGIFKSIDIWMNNMTEDSSQITESEIQSIIQSLQQTSWNVEIEIECVYQGKCIKQRCLGHSCDEKQPKITNNSIKVTKIL